MIRRLARNRIALVGAVAFGLLVLAYLTVPTLFPHDPYAVEFDQKLQGRASPTRSVRTSSAVTWRCGWRSEGVPRSSSPSGPPRSS